MLCMQKIPKIQDGLIGTKIFYLFVILWICSSKENLLDCREKEAKDNHNEKKGRNTIQNLQYNVPFTT